MLGRNISDTELQRFQFLRFHNPNFQKNPNSQQYEQYKNSFLGNQKNHYAEVATTCHSLVLAKNQGVSKLWLEGDSLNVINCLLKKYPPSWSIVHFINDSIAILNSFEEIKVFHIFREANRLVDGVANVGVVERVDWGSFESLRLNLKCISNDDQLACF